MIVMLPPDGRARRPVAAGWRPMVVAALVGVAACGPRSPATPPSPPSPPVDAAPARPAPAREPATRPSDPWHDLQEGVRYRNDCVSDADCHVAGCADYLCSAETEVLDACDDAPALPPIAATCGCVQGRCLWWRPRGYAGPGSAGQPCVDGYCLSGLACSGSAPGTCR